MSLTYFPSPRAHPALNFEAVTEAFAGLGGSPEGRRVTSAYDLYAVEVLRDRLGLRQGETVPTDVFVWGQGEPKDRTLTKVGGLPYWEAEAPWPERGGKPLYFLAQFNFRDSADLVGDVPGEILLLFTDDALSWTRGGRTGLHAEWIRIGTKRLTVERLVPKPPAPFFKGYGIIHRAADHPGMVSAAVGLPGVGHPGYLPVLHGTKIGGVPASPRVKGPKGGRFLAQLGTIQAASGVDYPWVNRPRPLGTSADASGVHGETNLLRIGEGGALYLFLRPDGSVAWEVDPG